MGYDAAIDSIAKTVQHPEAEYTATDGLKHCSECNEATQCRITIFGKERIVPCVCRCIKAQREREAEELRLAEVERKKRLCFQLPTMTAWTFENDDRSSAKLSDAMQRYAAQFPDFLKDGKGLLLFGTVGTGKSYYAACIANRLIENGFSAKMTNFAALTNDIQGMFEGKNQYIADLNRYQLLIIDDLGAERKSEFMQEIVFNIIDSRYRSGLPMIITTNLTGEALKHPQNIEFARIYDRLMQCCLPLEVSGESRRKKELRETATDVKKRLGL